LDSRKDVSEKLFRIGWDVNSTMLGELGVPDRYIDIFQGRALKSVLAKFYIRKELLRLKRIYEKANLKF